MSNVTMTIKQRNRTHEKRRKKRKKHHPVHNFSANSPLIIELEHGNAFCVVVQP